MSIGMSIKGMPKALAYVKLGASMVTKQTKDSLSKVGLHMQNEVKESIAGQKEELTSVDTGRFLNSVDFNTSFPSVIIFSDIPYAEYLEFGTSRIAPRGHFQNSLNRNKFKIKEILKNNINNI